jgi:O-acetyl-ADP-ribose deacetylase (regulator of RNase III)
LLERRAGPLDEIDRHIFMNIKKTTAELAYDLICERLRLNRMGLWELSADESESLVAAKAEIAKGLFGFPTLEAARIAVDAVTRK